MRMIAPVVLAALLTAGCAGSSGTVESGAGPRVTTPEATLPVQQSSVDVTVLRQVHYDYDPADSPEELAKTGRHDVIAEGTVETILQGDEIAEGPNDQQPAQYVVMKVRVSDTFRTRAAGQINEGHVYVVLWQGPRYNDPQGTPEFSLAHWNKAIPQGTSVMMFLTETAEGVRPGSHGVPANVRAMTPDVQGLIVDNAGTLVNGLEEFEGQWHRVKSMAELSQRVRAAVR
jgi:hypothetical protein